MSDDVTHDLRRLADDCFPHGHGDDAGEPAATGQRYSVGAVPPAERMSSANSNPEYET
jgi:hypothetical protein